MAELDYYWSTAMIINAYSDEVRDGLGFSVEQFGNARRLWSSETINDALQLFQNHTEFPGYDGLGTSASPYFASRSSYSTPVFWQTVNLDVGDAVRTGGGSTVTGYGYSVDIYVFSYIYNDTYNIDRTVWNMIIGIPKTYSATSVLTPAATYTPHIVYPLGYPPFDPRVTYASSNLGLLTGDTVSVVAKPTAGSITLQLGRVGDFTGAYRAQPGHENDLTKYKNPVRRIRAKFATTRVAIIEDTIHGGFMVYEEVAGSPSGNVYVYNGNRRLTNIIDATLIAQWRAYDT